MYLLKFIPGILIKYHAPWLIVDKMNLNDNLHRAAATILSGWFII